MLPLNMHSGVDVSSNMHKVCNPVNFHSTKNEQLYNACRSFQLVGKTVQLSGGGGERASQAADHVAVLTVKL